MSIKPCSGCGNYFSFCTCNHIDRVYAPCISLFVPEVGHGNEVLSVRPGPDDSTLVTYGCGQCGLTHDSRRVK